MTDRERAGALLLALLHASSPADVAGPINGEAVEDSLPENGVNRLRIGVRTTGSGSPIVTSKLRPGERKPSSVTSATRSPCSPAARADWSGRPRRATPRREFVHVGPSPLEVLRCPPSGASLVPLQVCPALPR